MEQKLLKITETWAWKLNNQKDRKRSIHVINTVIQAENTLTELKGIK